MNTTTPRKTLNENTLFCSEFRGCFRARAVFKGFRPLRRDNIWRCGRTLLTNTIAAQQQTKPNWFSNETKLGFKLLLSRGQQGNLQIFKPHVQSHYFTKCIFCWNTLSFAPGRENTCQKQTMQNSTLEHK